MSGIYLPGMRMPIDCPYCPLSHWNMANEFTGCNITKRYFTPEQLCEYGRPIFCPLISVPDHGRLIDADALHEGLVSNHPAAIYAKSAPTVIPADKEDGGRPVAAPTKGEHNEE